MDIVIRLYNFNAKILPDGLVPLGVLTIFQVAWCRANLGAFNRCHETVTGILKPHRFLKFSGVLMKAGNSCHGSHLCLSGPSSHISHCMALFQERNLISRVLVQTPEYEDVTVRFCTP